MESCAKHTSHRSRLPERRRLRGGSPGRGRRPCGNLPWPAKPWRSFLAEPARSRIGQLPNTRKRSGLCRKGQGRSSTDAFPPNARNCRATRLPVPDGRPPKRLSVPESRLANHPASETPEGARGTGPVSGPRAAAPCWGPARRPNRQGRREPEFPQDRCASSGSETRRLPVLGTASPDEPKFRGEGRTRRYPALSRARRCSRELPKPTIQNCRAAPKSCV
jgi:hypothetical protein